MGELLVSNANKLALHLPAQENIAGGINIFAPRGSAKEGNFKSIMPRCQDIVRAKPERIENLK